jgi:hypothetical protein
MVLSTGHDGIVDFHDFFVQSYWGNRYGGALKKRMSALTRGTKCRLPFALIRIALSTEYFGEP